MRQWRDLPWIQTTCVLVLICLKWLASQRPFSTNCLAWHWFGNWTQDCVLLTKISAKLGLNTYIKLSMDGGILYKHLIFKKGQKTGLKILYKYKHIFCTREFSFPSPQCRQGTLGQKFTSPLALPLPRRNRDLLGEPWHFSHILQVSHISW